LHATQSPQEPRAVRSVSICSLLRGVCRQGHRITPATGGGLRL